jgi:hypothetical protein
MADPPNAIAATRPVSSFFTAEPLFPEMDKKSNAIQPPRLSLSCHTSQKSRLNAAGNDLLRS